MTRWLKCIWANSFLVIIIVVIVSTYYEQNTVISIPHIDTYLYSLNSPKRIQSAGMLTLEKWDTRRLNNISKVLDPRSELRKSDSRYHLFFFFFRYHLLTIHWSNDLNGPYQGQHGAWGLVLLLQKEMLGNLLLFFRFKVPEEAPSIGDGFIAPKCCPSLPEGNTSLASSSGLAMWLGHQ